MVAGAELLDPVLEGDEALGADIVKRALRSPIVQIAENCGLDGEVVAEKVRNLDKPNWGFGMSPLPKKRPAPTTRRAVKPASAVTRPGARRP